MEFLKSLFKDDEKIVGLCAFNKKNNRVLNPNTPQFSTQKLIYSTNIKNNFFLM